MWLEGLRFVEKVGSEAKGLLGARLRRTLTALLGNLKDSSGWGTTEGCLRRAVAIWSVLWEDNPDGR